MKSPILSLFLVISGFFSFSHFAGAQKRTEAKSGSSQQKKRRKIEVIGLTGDGEQDQLSVPTEFPDMIGHVKFNLSSLSKTNK